MKYGYILKIIILLVPQLDELVYFDLLSETYWSSKGKLVSKVKFYYKPIKLTENILKDMFFTEIFILIFIECFKLKVKIFSLFHISIQLFNLNNIILKS